MQAEAEFKEREGELHFVDYEFIDHPGTPAFYTMMPCV